MCCNAFGLGALNVYWIIFGSAMLVLNGLSYDCTTSMAMFSGNMGMGQQQMPPMMMT